MTISGYSVALLPTYEVFLTTTHSWQMLLSSFPWYHLAEGFYKFHRITFSYPLMHFGKMNHLKVPTPQIHYLISWTKFYSGKCSFWRQAQDKAKSVFTKKKKKNENWREKMRKNKMQLPYLICLNKMKQGMPLAPHSQQILWLCWGFRLLHSLTLKLMLKKKIQSYNISSSN